MFYKILKIINSCEWGDISSFNYHKLCHSGSCPVYGIERIQFYRGGCIWIGRRDRFTLALVIMAGLREELEFADVPEPFKGGPITLIIAGILALAFMGFGGMIAQ